MQGMEVHLVGEANDYVGKSMSGGNISIVPPPNSSFQVREERAELQALPGFARFAEHVQKSNTVVILGGILPFI